MKTLLLSSFALSLTGVAHAETRLTCHPSGGETTSIKEISMVETYRAEFPKSLIFSTIYQVTARRGDDQGDITLQGGGGEKADGYRINLASADGKTAGVFIAESGIDDTLRGRYAYSVKDGESQSVAITCK